MNNLKATPVSQTHPAFHVEDKRHPRFREWLIYRETIPADKAPLSFRVWESLNGASNA